MMTVKATRGEFTGRHMLLIMVSFFAVIVSVNILLAYLANKTWSGLVVENSYVESQQFNENVAARNAQIAKGNKAIFTYVPGLFTVALKGPDGKALVASAITVKLGRPVDERQDMHFVLLPRADGQYAADIKLANGIWTGEITVTLQDGSLLYQPVRFTAEG